jgi:histidinol dehydrogenase
MEVVKYPKRDKWKALCARPVFENANLDNTVGAVLHDIKDKGDAAVKSYTKKFDGVDLLEIELNNDKLELAEKNLSDDLKSAIQLAYKNIKEFHEAQRSTVVELETSPGVKCWQKAVAIEKVGLYIPGGTAPLFSTVLMLGIPAKIAGCKEIVLCTPPNKEGEIHPAILYSATLIGFTHVYAIGGIQAIGAMAYGTETVIQVDKIFGPGNQYVTAAKQLVSRDSVAIDMPAGPSEVLVIADENADAEFIATDLLSQAEHGVDSQVIFLTKNESIVGAVQIEVAKLLAKLPRKDMAEKSIANSRIIVLENDEQILDFTNLYAPEHLIISTDNADSIAENIVNAGSVFIGKFTPESAGDYASGTNHTLPTNGWASAYSGVNLDSFQKKITYQKISEEGLLKIGPAIEAMAAAEQLEAHKLAVSVRLEKIRAKKK